jgi:cation diffusion facilitator family transporter
LHHHHRSNTEDYGKAARAKGLPLPESRCPDEATGATDVPSAHEEKISGRAQAVKRVFLITLGLNLLVAAAKAVYSVLSGSVTLGADAFHSALDGSANLLALLGMHFSAAPADAGYPYGHRKVEILAALGVGVLITFGLFEVAESSLAALRGHRPPPSVGWTAFAVVLGSMAVNFFVARYEDRKGHELASPLLSADASHTHADLYASGAVLLSFLGARSGLYWADGVGGLILVVMVGHVAWQVFRDNIPSLLDAAIVDPARVTAIAEGIAGVRNIHKVRSRGTKWAVEIDLHMQVEADMKVDDAHCLARLVARELRSALPHISDVVVHIEPTKAPLPERPPSPPSPSAEALSP